MNAVAEHKISQDGSIVTWNGDGVQAPNVYYLYVSRVDNIESVELRVLVRGLLEKIQDRMSRRDVSWALTQIHNIPLQYHMLSDIGWGDVRRCTELYTLLLAENDRLFEMMYPSEFRRRTDQIMKKTP